MAQEKHVGISPAAEVDDVPDEIAENFISSDQRDMRRMGKKQELLRNFRILTSIAFTSCVMGTWEILLTSNYSGLLDGGLAGLWWSMIWCYVGQTFVVLSLSEMSSMAPTAGGQYHWVSEFAPPSLQKILSYCSGWFSTLAWQSFVAADSYICAALVQALVVLNNSEYEPQRWQTTLLMIAFVVAVGVFNIYFAKYLASIEGYFAIFHFTAWIAVVAVLWAMTPNKKSAEAVFTEFTDNGGGWNSMGLTVCVGQVGVMFTVVGSDASCHIGEEIRDAGVVVPRSMVWSFLLNILPTLVVLVTYLFCIGDLKETLAPPTGYPVVSVFQQSTGNAGATGLTTVLLILIIIVEISLIAATSRQTFAFARDNGMVASRWLAQVDQRHRVPTNSILFTIGFTVVMSLINIGSTTAFNAFLSVSVSALMSTYMISIGCILLKRLKGEPLPLARWKLMGKNAELGDKRGGLGRLGPAINGVAFLYSAWACFWSFWPLFNHPDPSSMNWAIVIFFGIIIIAGLAFVVHVRKRYDGPVTKVRVLEDESSSDS